MAKLEILVTAPELSEAINNLAKAISSGKMIGATVTNTTSAGADAIPEVAHPTPTPVAQPAPVPETPNPTTPNSAQPTATGVSTPTNASYHSEAQPTIPTSAPQYTLDMIAKAGTALVDAGKMNELMALLAKFGVEVLTSLPTEHYGAFVTELRALGANI